MLPSSNFDLAAAPASACCHTPPRCVTVHADKQRPDDPDVTHKHSVLQQSLMAVLPHPAA